MNILLFFALTLIILGIIFLLILRKISKSFGILSKKRIYEDTQKRPGETIFAKTIPLVGKPDYLVKEKGIILPVELKTGKTPTSPYLNHTMQLMAYCLLVDEQFGIRPPGGYIKYPDKEFKIAYTKEAEESVRSLVKEMLEKKRNGEELFCNHPQHNF